MSLEDFKDHNQNTVVDLDNLDEYPDLNKSDIDLEADAFESVAPPKPGKYRLKLALAEDGVQLKQGRKGNQYYSAALECTIISDDKNADGAKAYVYVSTAIGRGKATSTMATLIVKGGGTISNKSATQKDILRDFANYIKGSPEQWADMDWELSYEDKEGKYKTIYSSYKEFPGDSKTGEKQFRFSFKKSDGSKVQVSPRLVVKQWLGLTGETKSTNSVSATSSAKTLGSLSGNETIEDLEKQL